jgi:hypothetical protein
LQPCTPSLQPWFWARLRVRARSRVETASGPFSTNARPFPIFLAGFHNQMKKRKEVEK